MAKKKAALVCMSSNLIIYFRLFCLVLCALFLTPVCLPPYHFFSLCSTIKQAGRRLEEAKKKEAKRLAAAEKALRLAVENEKTRFTKQVRKIS